MLEFECPHCSEVLNIPEEFVGSTGTCKKCGREITIEAKATHDQSDSLLPPALVAFHCETTGPSTRKCNITELAGVKFDLNGKEVDTFSSFANPGHMIPPRISEKTGIRDDMIEGAPPSKEVIKLWFEWVGPHALLFSHHAHFDSKFVCASLLKENLDPPALRVIDVLGWARHLEVPVEDYKLRMLLDFIGYRVKRAHRALETCHGVGALASHLTRRQVGVHNVTGQSGVFGKLMGKTEKSVNEAEAFSVLTRLSKSLEDICGDGFFSKVRDDPRLRRRQSLGPMGGSTTASIPVASRQGNGAGIHRQEWFDERRGILERSRHERAGTGVTVLDESPGNSRWEYVLLDASQTEDPAEQKKLCEEAVALGAQDPWPFGKLTSLLIKEKNYRDAHEICEKYFASGFWKSPQWADPGLKILRRMEKLERKLEKDG